MGINYIDFNAAILQFPIYDLLFTYLQTYNPMEFSKRKRKQRFGMFKRRIFNLLPPRARI